MSRPDVRGGVPREVSKHAMSSKQAFVKMMMMMEYCDPEEWSEHE